MDLYYGVGDTDYVHVSQSHLPIEELAVNHPVATGDPTSVGGVTWRANALPAAQTGREHVVMFSARMPDGRTVSIDSNLGADEMKHVLQSLR